jgi:sarcosine oxidase subunit beta
MIAILGGGIAGASLARALALRGRRDVVVFDPNRPATGSTGMAMGGYRTQFVNPLNIALSLASRSFFESRRERISFRSVGYLLLATDQATVAELEAREEIQTAAGLPIERVDPAALIPFFDGRDVLRANYCHLDGVYLPRLVLAALVEEARDAGAELRYETAVRPEDLDAELIVVAAGNWSTEVAASLGVRLAVEPLEKGIYLVPSFPGLTPDMPLTINSGVGWSMREREGKLAVQPPAGPDWGYVRDFLARRIPAAAVDEPLEWWTGSYEMTFDLHPLVGRTERPGVWASCGFSGHGVMHSPAIAESLAAMMLGETPPVDISALDPLRTVALFDRTQV